MRQKNTSETEGLKLYEILILIFLIFLLELCVWMWGFGAGQTHPEIIYKDSIRVERIIDSIYIVNDSIETKIIYVEKKHEEEVADIINNTDSTNLVFFSEYISNYQRTITDR